MRQSAKFIPSPSGLECRAALLGKSAGIYFLSPTHPLLSLQCQAAPQVRVHSTTVFRLQVSPSLWPGRAPCPERGHHLCRRRCRDCKVPVRFTRTWDRLMGYSYLYVPHRFLPRLFLCTPSFRRCGVTSTVCCGSGWFSLLPLVSFSRLASSFSTGPQEWTRQLQWEYIQLSFTPY